MPRAVQRSSMVEPDVSTPTGGRFWPTLVLVLRLWRLAKPVMRADLPQVGEMLPAGRRRASSSPICQLSTAILGVIFLYLLLATPRLRALHADRLRPADGAIVQAAPKQFSLTFNEPVSPLVLKLVRPDGSSSPLDHYALEDATLVIDAPELAERHACAVLAGRLGRRPPGWRVAGVFGWRTERRRSARSCRYAPSVRSSCALAQQGRALCRPVLRRRRRFLPGVDRIGVRPRQGFHPRLAPHRSCRGAVVGGPARA